MILVVPSLESASGLYVLTRHSETPRFLSESGFLVESLPSRRGWEHSSTAVILWEVPQLSSFGSHTGEIPLIEVIRETASTLTRVFAVMILVETA